MSNTVEESFSNVRTVKAFANETEELVKFDKGNQKTYEIGFTKALWNGLFMFLVQVMGFGAVGVVIYFAAMLNKDGKIQVGEITAFLFYMIMLIMNFGMLASVFGNVMSLVGASDMIVALMEYEPKINTEGG